MKKGPWTVLGTKEIYKNPWMTVFEDKVLRPDGKEGIYGYVKQRGGVSVVPIDDEGNVYLTEEYRYAIEEDSIEAASGALDEGEDPLSTAKRELKEELGIEAEEWINLGMVHPFSGLLYSPLHLFLAKKLKFGEANPDGTEIIKTIKVSFEEAVEMVKDGRITHSPTCVLILKAMNS